MTNQATEAGGADTPSFQKGYDVFNSLAALEQQEKQKAASAGGGGNEANEAKHGEVVKKEWNVIRRYNDFDWLYHRLVKQ